MAKNYYYVEGKWSPKFTTGKKIRNLTCKVRWPASGKPGYREISDDQSPEVSRKGD
ncbi:hypothetical protein [Methanosarcina siciliae]|uniref:hypothetical protein n=1 Tax=Methanosarcina siciliae TaxID=38027 RepID=UPI000AB04CF8|nr:hypothetical protein [Methanosarcina siciliae]